MFVPEFFHGKFSDIEKKLTPLRSRNKTLDAVQNLYDVINQTMSDEACGEGAVISLSDDYISRTMTDAYYPFLFSNYITFEEDDDSDITRWFKEKSLECRWCQLSALAENSLVQFLYADRDYARQLGDSVCSNWDFYLSFGERFCFMPRFMKKDNRYFFWENNIALAKLLFSVIGRRDLISIEELEVFPVIWQKYVGGSAVIKEKHR